MNIAIKMYSPCYSGLSVVWEWSQHLPLIAYKILWDAEWIYFYCGFEFTFRSTKPVGS